MRIPWRKLLDAVVAVVNAVAPGKAQADPPKEPTADELWDRWDKRGPKLAFFVCALSILAHPSHAQQVDSACVAAVMANADTLARLHLPGAELYPTQRRSRDRINDVARARCTPVKPDTVQLTVHDTITMVVHDTLYLPAQGDSTRPDTLVTPPDTVPAPPDTVTPPDTTPPSLPPPASGVAELPRSVPTWPAGLASAACTDTVSGNAWQAAVNTATAGDVLCFSGVYLGTITLPNRPDSGWVVLRSLVSPVAPGTRVRPSDAQYLASIVATGTNAAIISDPKAHGWYLRELEVSTDPTLATLTIALIDLQTPPTVSGFARDLVFDRVYAHGWPARELRRCVSLQSASTAIINSWLDDCHEKGSDSQAIAGWSGPGPFLIENNHLAGSTETVMFGGADPKFAGVHPCDITMRRNHVYSPLAWKGVWTKKHLLELKNACRLLIERNVFDGSYLSAQGHALNFKSTNQGGTAAHRDQSTRDVTVRWNLIVNSAGALSLNGKGGNVNTDSVTRRVVFYENYADSLGGAYGLETRGVMILSGARDVHMIRNVWLAPPGQVNSYTGSDFSTSNTATHLTIDGDVLTRGKYLLSGCWTAVCTPGLSMRAALIGSGTVPALFTGQYPDLTAALAAGYGVSRATIDAAVAGVVIHP